MTRLFISLIMIMITFYTSSVSSSYASPKEDKTKKRGQRRSKSLEFDNSVVEGLNTNPLDSLETIGKKDRGKMPHLYNKKMHLKRELQNSMKDLGNSP